VDDVPVQLIEATQAHLQSMLCWFPTAPSCTLWGGPEFRFPFTFESFVADSKLTSIPSYGLIEESGKLCGFGQYYLRAGRCHLARLAVAPDQRGRGLGTRLIGLLQEKGKETLRVTESSLFVHVNNPSALALYERLGFMRAPYPEPGAAMPDAYYMVSSAR
jgi:ribosomal protein S18 acetylase RimI-like enzyme